MVLAHTLHNESDLCQDADDVSKALLSSPSASRCLLTSTTVLGTCLLVQKYLLTSTKVQILTSRSLAPMSLEQLKLLAEERGVKREGVGWAASCSPAGSRASGLILLGTYDSLSTGLGNGKRDRDCDHSPPVSNEG